MTTEPHPGPTPEGDLAVTLEPRGAVPPRPVTPAPAPADDASLGRFGVRPKLLCALLIGNGTAWIMYFTPVLAAMPARIKELSPGGYTGYYSLTLTLATLVGLLSGPLAGHLSDRSGSRFGRRRPWLLGAMAVGLVGTVAMGLAPSVPVFVVGAMISQIGFGATTAVQLSLLPEHVPVARRGSFGALFGVSTAVSTVIGVVLTGGLASAGHIPAAFLSVGVLGAGGALFLAFTIPGHGVVQERAPMSLRSLAGAFWINPRRYPDFAWGWLSRFMVYLSFASVTTYQLFYLSDQLRIPAERAEGVFVPIGTALQVLTTVIGALVGGYLSDRYGRRKPFVALAAALAVVGLVVLAVATAIPLYVVGVLLIGLAGGIYVSVDIALMTAVLPHGVMDAGRDLGVLNIANTLPNTLSPAFAPAFLSIGFFSVAAETNGHNYTMLFLGSAVFALVSVFSVLKIKSVR